MKRYMSKNHYAPKKTEIVDIVEELSVKLRTKLTYGMLFRLISTSNTTINCLQTEKSRLNKHSTKADQHVCLSKLSQVSLR